MKVVVLVILPESRPEASGRRTMMPTLAFCAAGSSGSTASWRKRLKMVWSDVQPWRAQGEHPLLHRLHAGAPVADHAGVAHVVEPGEDLAIAQHVDGDAVELGEVEHLDAEPLERAGEAVLDLGLV